MQIDDRLATVLRQRAGGEAAARIQYRQLLDLLGTLPSDAQGPELDAAYERLGELSQAIPAGARAAMLREPGSRLRNPKLAVLLCGQEQPVAAAAIGAADLGEEEWLDLAPALPVAARALLRTRRDLGPRVERRLAQLGIVDRGLPPAREAGMAADAATSSKPAGKKRRKPEQGIGAIVQRIEDFRKTHRPLEGEVRESGEAGAARPATRQTAPVCAFAFATDPQARIVWSEPGVAPMAVGLKLAPPDGLASAQGSKELAARLREHQPIRAAKIAIAGAPAIAGDWLADAAPHFDPATGGFTGYRGRMRRLCAADEAQAEPRQSEADRVRQLLHELRTPVNAIQGFAEVIQQQVFGPAPHEYRALAAGIAADAARVLAGFGELEQLARLESGALEREQGACDFAAVLAATLDQLAPFTSSRDSGFAFDVAPGEMTVALARQDAERLAWRLLATLAAAAHPGEVTRLDAVRDGPCVSVRLQLPTSLAAREGSELLHAAAAPPASPLNAGMFGTGFTLRLATAEARAAGGSLERQGMDLCLALPALDRNQIEI